MSKKCRYCATDENGCVVERDDVLVPIRGKAQRIDHCIHDLVAALNAAGIVTEASCCGHGLMKGNIVLADGRTLIVQDTPATMGEWKKVCKL